MGSGEVDEDEAYWRQTKDDEELEWSHDSSHVITQLAQCFTNAMVGPRSWFIGLFARSNNKRNDKYLDYTLSPLQEQRLQRLQERLHVPFDETRPDHQEALRALWFAAFPDIALKGLISEQWKDMGWQGPNPSTDFRLLFKQDGKRATWEYPFAVAGINVSFMLIQMLDLYSEDEEAFDVLYCIAFEMMDAQWLAMHASYMEFNDVLQVTRTQLERELSLEDIHRVQDLPAYNLLYQ
ncbi:ELMO domain-containing protein A [Morus notabilis]|uniref:ELMO domain-containing protein A n=1 Tax=Morus notabilis TaxID=981085 RepID=W9QVU9_9ROSA|nr:ELMO domain-containing protein A [Morus notabilis]